MSATNSRNFVRACARASRASGTAFPSVMGYFPALALMALGLACGEEATTFTDLRVTVRVQGAEVTPATGDTGDGATDDGADGGTPADATDGGTAEPPAPAYAGPEVEFTVRCGADSIGPRGTVNGEVRFSTRLNPPDRLAAGPCTLVVQEVPEGWLLNGNAEQPVEVLDSAVTRATVLVTPVTPHPAPPLHPEHPCDPATADCNGNGVIDTLEPGQPHDPAEPFGELRVIVRRDSADGEPLNGLTVTVGPLTATTGPGTEEEGTGFAVGEAVFEGLSLVTAHTIVVTDPEGSLGSQTATVAFTEGQTEVTQPFVLLPSDDRWGNGTGPELTVGDAFSVPWAPCLDGTCSFDGASCTASDEAVLTVTEDCHSVTPLAPGSATVTARRGTHSAALAFTVVAAP